MANVLSIGVIGTGRIGSLHARHLGTLVDGTMVAAVSDVNETAARECAAQAGVPAAYTDHRRILDRRDIDAVAICSSTDTHSQLITEAAEAGKHIFCEKPIDFDLERIDRALQAVKLSGVKLQVGFNRRFDPSFRRVWTLVQAGEVGQVHLLRITSRDPSPPPIEYVKGSGGMFLDMTIHDFDMARYLAGSEVTEVYATGGVLVDPAIGRVGDIDTAVVTLRFASGAFGMIDNSRQSVYGYDQRVEVFGAKGMAEAANEYPNAVRLSNSQTIQSDLPLHFFMDRYVQSYIEEMRAFAACVTDDAASPVTGRDGRMPVVMGRAAARSLELNRPVTLAEVDKEEAIRLPGGAAAIVQYPELKKCPP